MAILNQDVSLDDPGAVLPLGYLPLAGPAPVRAE